MKREREKGKGSSKVLISGATITDFPHFGHNKNFLQEYRFVTFAHFLMPSCITWKKSNEQI